LLPAAPPPRRDGAEEAPFFENDKPWSRAHAIVAGTPELPHDERTEVVVAPPPA
jgi:hypothetical protein